MILLMPVIPFIEDSNENILQIIRLAKENGAKFIYPAFGVTLRQKKAISSLKLRQASSSLQNQS